jgi:protein tyrosine phosphatase (PTP) superfamily phosphohydrolase (DUF442 family)
MKTTARTADWWIGIILAVSGNVGAAELGDISNFRAYSETLASSGQPTAEQLEAIRDAGYARVVYLAYSDSHGALEHEDQLVETLGLEFFNVPVDWEAPKKSDFYAFAAILEQAPNVPTLVHCQVNFRASSFSFLYRVLYGEVPIGEAKDTLDSVWVPNGTWRAFIFEVLEENGVDPDCDTCLWAEN